MDELQTLIKPVLVHNTCCHAKLAARRDKGKWIKESGSQLLPSRRHDSGSGRKCLGEQCWEAQRGAPQEHQGCHTHSEKAAGTGRLLCRATAIDHQHTAAARRDELRHETLGKLLRCFHNDEYSWHECDGDE